MFTYTPKYRPPQFSGLPKGWELLATPSDRAGLNRPDLPTSRHRFGVIGYAEQLTKEEAESCELNYLGMEIVE